MRRSATWLNRDKPRPFAVAATLTNDVTLVYGSTQRTERHSGAASIEVAPRPTGVNRNGLRVPTLFYPGTLVLARTGTLPAPAGFLGKSIDALRATLRLALGIGQGSCLVPGVPANSLRGRIVVLNAAVAETLNTFLAVILTEHRYSAERRYQVILPILRAPTGPSRVNELIISWRSWHAVFPAPVQAAVFPIPTTLSLWHSAAVAHETEYVLDEDSLAEIDRHLCAYFSLPYAPREG